MHTADGIAVNRSSTLRGDVNRGNKGLFTEEQTRERIRVHAKAVALKYPTITEIVRIWKDKYDIDITRESEAQWRKSNWSLIEKTKQGMVESGEIQTITTGPKALSESLSTLSLDTTKTMIDMRRKLHLVMSKINVGADTDKEHDRNRENIKLFSAITDGLTKLSNSLTKQLLTLVELSGGINARKSKEDALKELNEESSSPDFDASAVVVTDEDRASS